MENKNISKVVIGVLAVLVLALGGCIAVSGGKSAATANGASEAAQPYCSDRTTKTNSGIVKLTLTVG